jgi:hypothetical protein
MSEQVTTFPSAECECCVLDFTGADWERKSIRISQSLYVNAGGADFYDAQSLDDLDWGDHKKVDYFLGVYSLVDDIDRFFAENFPEDGGDAICKIQYRWHIELRGGLNWREIDGPGIKVEWAEAKLLYTYDPILGYIDPVASNDQLTENITVAIGDSQVWGESHDLISAPSESISLQGPDKPARFSVNVYLASDPPTATLSGAGPLAGYYSQNRRGTDTPFEMTFTAFTPPIEVTWKERTVDVEGVQVGVDVDQVLTLTADPQVHIVPAPDSSGRIYCFGFLANTMEVNTFPVVTPTQECITLPT